MTTLDLLDDALKIGLGSALTLLGTKLGQKREWRRDMARHHIAAIEKVAEDIQVAHNAAGDYATQARAAKRLNEQPTPADFITNARRRAATAQSALELIGAHRAAVAVGMYMRAIGLMIRALKHSSPEAGEIPAMENVEKKRFDVFAELRSEYVKAQTLEESMLVHLWARLRRQPVRKAHERSIAEAVNEAESQP